MIICIGLNTKEITENAVTFFIAGYDTTANTLAFACYCLATNEDVQEKLVEEIDTVLQGVCIYRHYMLIVRKYKIICTSFRKRTKRDHLMCIFPVSRRVQILCFISRQCTCIGVYNPMPLMQQMVKFTHKKAKTWDKRLDYFTKGVLK